MFGRDSSFLGTRSSAVSSFGCRRARSAVVLDSGALYAIPREKSVRRFMDQVRALTSRRVPLKTKEMIEELNPVLRGWGHHYQRAPVRKLFHRLGGWLRGALRQPALWRG